MSHTQWIDEFPAAITVADAQGTILSLNQRAQQTFAKDGGIALVGRSLFDCHPEAANQKIRQIMQERQANAYTIEKNGVKKLIYQAPWYENGVLMGVVEFSLPIPETMPHFVRS